MKNKTICIIKICMSLFLFANCNRNKFEEHIDYYEGCRRLVLNENAKGQEFVFKISKNEIDESRITYLGYIKTVQGDTLKLLNYIHYSGLYDDAKKANGAVILYSNDAPIGRYYVGDLLSLPTRIEDEYLVFDYDNRNCNQKTLISFRDSIPKQIFVNCSGTGGDLYTFTKE